MDYDPTLGEAMVRAGTKNDIDHLKKRVASLEADVATVIKQVIKLAEAVALLATKKDDAE